MTTKPIVVATDGSAPARLAVQWAAAEATLRGAPLRIVSAAEILPRMSGEPAHPTGFETVAAHLVGLRSQALAAAAKTAAAVAPDLLIDTDPVDGPPAQAVTASGSGAQLLVVGSRGAGAFAALTLGSVSRYVAGRGPCPVVVVRDRNPGEDDEAPAGHYVVVGIKNPADCSAALTFAFEEARLRNRALFAVHAWQWGPKPPGGLTAELDDLLSVWRGKYPEVDVDGEVIHGQPGRTLAELSARADLVVLGRHHQGDRAMSGPAKVIHAVVGHAHGPVAVIPPGNPG